MTRTNVKPATAATQGTTNQPTVYRELPAASAADRIAEYLLGDQDLFLFNEGTHSRLYEKLGSHCLPDGTVYFAVWAPNAQYVSVIGDFNDWDRGQIGRAHV